MKKNIVYLFSLLLSISVVGSGCKEGVIAPLEKNTVAPGKVSNVVVVNGPGNAKLTYALPADKDLLYVKAVYKLATGRVMEVKSSYYGNSI